MPVLSRRISHCAKPTPSRTTAAPAPRRRPGGRGTARLYAPSPAESWRSGAATRTALLAMERTRRPVRRLARERLEEGFPARQDQATEARGSFPSTLPPRPVRQPGRDARDRGLAEQRRGTTHDVDVGGCQLRPTGRGRDMGYPRQHASRYKPGSAGPASRSTGSSCSPDSHNVQRSVAVERSGGCLARSRASGVVTVS